MTSTRWPSWASAAATLTVVVVLPTPPFWLATTITRVASGRGIGGRAAGAPERASTVCSAARASGVVSSSKLVGVPRQLGRGAHRTVTGAGGSGRCFT